MYDGTYIFIYTESVIDGWRGEGGGWLSQSGLEAEGIQTVRLVPSVTIAK